jgi:hypothetical protein
MSTPACALSDSPYAHLGHAHRAGAPLVEPVARCGSRPCRQRPAIVVVVRIQLALAWCAAKISLEGLGVDEIGEVVDREDGCVLAFEFIRRPIQDLESAGQHEAAATQCLEHHQTKGKEEG